MLEELQSLSAGNKKRVLVVTTVILMVIVIGVWAVYFNSVIMGTMQPVSTEAAEATTTSTGVAPQVAQANGPSLWQNIKDGFGSIANVFKKPSQYNIQPQSN
jgi:flagellar basal body-associated protein FliL